MCYVVSIPVLLVHTAIEDLDLELRSFSGLGLGLGCIWAPQA